MMQLAQAAPMSAGFAKVSHKRMLFGTVALHQAQA